MNAQHTEGPWMAAASPSSIVGWPVIAQSGRAICSITTPPRDIKRVGKQQEDYEAFMAECVANARLIAAAPDMLAVLKAADHTLSVHGKIDGGTPLHERIAAVIAKATNPLR